MDETDLDPDFGVHERIFHYTSAEGLYGILTSNCLWATHFQFLNDSREFYAARESLVEFVKKELHKMFVAWSVNGQIKFKKGEDIQEAAQHEAAVIVDAMYETTYQNLGNPYVFSGFCCGPDHDAYQNGGLLNWATYGQNGGYALRLNPHLLGTLLQKEAKKYSLPIRCSKKVVYSSDAASSPLLADYKQIAQTAKAIVTGHFNDELQNVDVGQAAPPFARVSSLLKDAYFRYEAEARVVLVRPLKKLGNLEAHPLKMRHRGGVTIPHIELFKHELLGPHCPIEAILIGPHSERSRRKLALKVFLESINLTSIEVIESDVPYVG